MDWSSRFDDFTRESPASREALASLRATLAAPPSPDEIAAIVAGESNPFPVSDPYYASWTPTDPRPWRLPDVPLPTLFLDLLRWSDGGWFRRGERELGFFGTAELRDMAFGYKVPEYMPGAIPIGLDGGGVFAMFDARGGPADEYPIVVIGAGDLDFDDAVLVCDTFEELCFGEVALGDIYSPEPEGPWPGRRVRVLITHPPDDLKILAEVRRLLNLDLSLGELRRRAAKANEATPLLLTDALSYMVAQRDLDPLNELPGWLTLVDDGEDS